MHARTENKRIIRRLAILFVATVVVTLICAQTIYLLERYARRRAGMVQVRLGQRI